MGRFFLAGLEGIIQAGAAARDGDMLPDMTSEAARPAIGREISLACAPGRKNPLHGGKRLSVSSRLSMTTPSRPDPAARPWLWWGGLGLVTLLALLPWWRNHAYLRDFYDYGLVMASNARLGAGEKPYVDYVTPIQTAVFALNRGAEKLGGGTYVGMTRGGAALIAVGVVLLCAMLVRQWSRGAALVVGAAVVICSASQHTIIWHNVLGVFALAMVSWSFALAPVWRRATLGWHTLAAAGLLLGGTNKLNFHLVACALAAGWVLHALAVRREPLGRGLITLGAIVLFGWVVPVVAELAWTGASFPQWLYNVVEMPFAARAGTLEQLLSARFYFTTVHIYYGDLRLPPAGAISVGLAAVAAVAAGLSRTGERRGLARIFAGLAGVLAAASAAALLATNNEIAYVVLAAALVLAVSLWLGFGLPDRGGWFVAGLLGPALVLAACGWESAWRGQRSQFGHYDEPRAEYLSGEAIGADFGYVRGLHLPRSIVWSLQAIAGWRNSLPEADRAGCYYGPAGEWLERIWPVTKVPGLPLWLHVGTSYGPREEATLVAALRPGGPYHHLLVPEPWDAWGEQVDRELKRSFMKERIGPVWFAYHSLPQNVLSTEPLGPQGGGLGGNLDATRLVSTMPRHQLADTRQFLGIESGTGELQVRAESFRASGEVVLQRTGTAGLLGPVKFEVQGMQGDMRIVRLTLEVSLPQDRDELVVPCKLDSSGLPLAYVVTIPPELSGRIRAGWRAPAFSHAGNEDLPLPPQLVTGASLPRDAEAAERAALLPADRREDRVVLRNARADSGRLVLPPGGEAWVRLRAIYQHIGVTAAGTSDAPTFINPVLRVVFYKGGRLETMSNTVLVGTTPVSTHAWAPEAGGWIGLLNTADRSAAPITVRIDAMVPPP